MTGYPLDPHIKAAAAVLVDTDTHQVLLAQRAPGMSHPGTWTNPGGTREGDELPIETVIREVREEIGLNILSSGALDIRDLLGTFAHAIPRGGRDQGDLIEVFYWRMRYFPVGDLKLDPKEVSAVRWLTLDRIRKLPVDLHPGAAVQLAYLEYSILPEIQS